MPTLGHDFKVTSDWLKDDFYVQYMHSGEAIETTLKVAGVFGGVVVGAIIAKKLLNALSDRDKN